MSDFKRCEPCGGRKVIRGLGMIEKECPTCFGIGWISSQPIEVKKSESQNETVVIHKKRGRKPKNASS